MIEFIKELHQVLHSLDSKKQRMSLSPSPAPSPKLPFQLISTPPSECNSLIRNATSNENVKELVASCNSVAANVEAKISGSNVILKTVSQRIPGQIVKIINVLETHFFEVLHLNISSMEDTVLYSFVIKV